MRTTLVSSIVLGLGLGLLGACAGETGASSLDKGELALVSVSADDLEMLDDGETLAIDLSKKNVVYEIDGDSARLDLDRLTVVTDSSASTPLRNYLDERAIDVDESDFFLRLAGDPALLVETSTLGSTSQALNNSSGGGGSDPWVCADGLCTCAGEDNCIDMLGEGGPCGGQSICEDSIPGYPVCTCTEAHITRPGGRVIVSRPIGKVFGGKVFAP